MHKPPAVDYPAGNARWFLRVWLGTWCAALAINCFWLIQAAPGDWRPWLGCALTLLGALVAARIGWISVEGALVWDGDVWWWEHGGARVRGVATSELDLQHRLLLRFVSDDGLRSWFLLERGPDTARWLALRRAVHGSTGPDDGTRAGERGTHAPDRTIEP